MDFNQAKYTIIKFIPDLVKNEPINIGLILHCWNKCYIRSEISDEKTKLIEKYNPKIPKDILQATIEDIKENFSSENWFYRENSYEDFKNQEYLNRYLSNYSNQLQFTSPSGVITDNLDKKFEELFSELIYYKSKLQIRKQYTTEYHMRSYMKKLFKERNLFKDKLVVEGYAEKGKYGENIKFDFKYLNGTINLINNLSFNVSNKDPLEYAKLWSKNYEDIKSICRKNNETRKIKTIIALEEDNEYKSIIKDCLMEYSDEMIDYNDKEQLKFLTKQISETAHL